MIFKTHTVSQWFPMKLAPPSPNEHFGNLFSMLSCNLQNDFSITANPDLFLPYSAVQFLGLKYIRSQPKAA